jgi:hypothetical protein
LSPFCSELKTHCEAAYKTGQFSEEIGKKIPLTKKPGTPRVILRQLGRLNLSRPVAFRPDFTEGSALSQVDYIYVINTTI